MKINNYVLILSSLFILPLVSCGSDESKDDDKNNPQTGTLDKTYISVYVDETSILTYSEGDCVWSSDNSLVATVENGVVKGMHVGTTTIHANNATCTVSVKSKRNSFIEPLMLWGASQATIKSKMSSYTLSKSSSTSLTYVGIGRVLGWGYTFENDALTLSMMAVTLLNGLDATDFLLDRYVVVNVNEQEKYTVLISPDNTVLVTVLIQTSGLGVGYTKYTPTKAFDYGTVQYEMKDLIQESSFPEVLSHEFVNEIFSRFSKAM